MSCQTSPLCPLAWTLDSSPPSLRKTEKPREASRSCGGSEWGQSVQAVSVLPSVHSSSRLSHQDQTQPVWQPSSGPRLRTGPFQKRRLQVHGRTQTGPTSKRAVTQPPTPPHPWPGDFLSRPVVHLLSVLPACQKPEAAFCQVEPGSGVQVAGGGRAGPVPGPRSPLAQRRPNVAVGDAAGSGAGRMVTHPPHSLRSTCPIPLPIQSVRVWFSHTCRRFSACCFVPLLPWSRCCRGHAVHTRHFLHAAFFFSQELVLKNPLHRKKLQLALKTITSKQPETSAELDHIWVTRTYGRTSRVQQDSELVQRETVLFHRLARRHRTPAVQGPVQRGPSGRTDAAVPDRGERSRGCAVLCTRTSLWFQRPLFLSHLRTTCCT